MFHAFYGIVFKNGPSKICGIQPFEGLWSVNRPYHFKFFKDYIPQILFGPYLYFFPDSTLKYQFIS